MKIKLIFIIILTLQLISCNNKKSMELTIVNDELTTIVLNGNDSISEGYKNILIYKLTNNSDKTYYFNLNVQSKLLVNLSPFKLKYIPINNGGICFTDKKNDTLTIGSRIGFNPFPFHKEFILNQEKRASEFGYNINGLGIINNNNFIIHPNETLYFEELIYLPKNDKVQYNEVNFDNKKKYCASIFLYSDSTRYKNVISKADLNTIKENNYEVFNGIIKSNQIPIRFINK